MFQLGGAYWMAVAGTAATLLASSLTVISIKSLVAISFRLCHVCCEAQARVRQGYARVGHLMAPKGP